MNMILISKELIWGNTFCTLCSLTQLVSSVFLNDFCVSTMLGSCLLHLLTYHYVQTRIPLRMKFASLNNKTNGITSWAANPSVTPEFTIGFYWGSYWSIVNFLCSDLLPIVCLLFYWAIWMSVLLRLTALDYYFGIFKLHTNDLSGGMVLAFFIFVELH